MTTHLSARLAWHDRGWDGRICSNPHLNAHCMVHPHIRDSRNDIEERNVAGKHLAELNWLPPCSRDPGAYADRGFVIEHQDPLEFRKLPAVSEQLPPYSVCPAPYRWMREEFFREVCETEDISIRGSEEDRDVGWVREADRQRDLLKRFWGKLQPQESLIFYYCNYGHPLDEKSSRVIVGVGRISDIGSQLYFGKTREYPESYPVWSRRITQAYPDQGVRIPYQEYLRENLSTDEIICNIPPSVQLAFSYGSEHVSADIAVLTLERIIQSIERVKEDGHVKNDWENRLIWLNDVLAEIWVDRGAFPGAGSVLQYLGFSKGVSFQRTELASMVRRGENPWAYVRAMLEGKIEPKNKIYKPGLLRARDRWRLLKRRQELLSKLAQFEISAMQVERIVNPDQRRTSGIDSTEEELVENPYIISERDVGTKDSRPIALETIDHGLRSGESSGHFGGSDEMLHDDKRRVRAIGMEVLRDAAQEGDTVLTFDDFIDRISKCFPKQCACRPDREIVLAEEDFYSNLFWMDVESAPQLVALKRLQSLEQDIVSTIKRRVRKKLPIADPPINWLEVLETLFGKPRTVREKAALDEKCKALDTLFSQRLSVLTGGAGTGKTSVLRVFLQELVRVEGRDPILLLAPTGKARVRLSTATGYNAMTIHQFLLKQGWLDPEVFVLKSSSSEKLYQAKTVIIDECSMIPTDLFGTLLRSLDRGPLSRLILVGDPNQLPPIGPGRPFADIIEWIRNEYPECLYHLDICMRTSDENQTPGEDSIALALAEGYRTSVVSPGDDEILAAIAQGDSKGDLDIVFWDSRDNLLKQLKDRMIDNLKIHENDYHSFNHSLGIDAKDWRHSEAWQILSPTRAQFFGTDDLNRLIQEEYKRGLIARTKQPNSKYPRFGDQEIVYTDKIIQINNQSRKSWPRNGGLDYVANGEVGIVTNAIKGNGGAYLDAVFSTQPEVSYRYYQAEVEENMELAYALTVHKAQGSDFDVVFLIIPQSATNLSRELIYTGFTRFRRKLVLLIEKDTELLRRLRSPEYSATQLRNTHMFTMALRPDETRQFHLKNLIHRTRNGTAVRSKSEVIVADILDTLGISYEYEKPLLSRSDSKDFRLPDFTVSFEGDAYYWEHLGMLDVPAYREAWERKMRWYENNGYSNRLITSEDGPEGSIDAGKIEHLARNKILDE